MKQDEFLFLHDHFIEIGKYSNQTSFLTVNPIDFGISNSICIISTFWDKLAYTLLYNLGYDISLIQRLIVVFLLSISLNLPLLGFRKISIFFDIKAAPLTLYMISLFYSFNSYTLIFWNSGVLMSVSASLTYYCAPLAFVTFHKAVFVEDSKFIDKIKSCLLLFVMSFAIYLSIVFVFFLVLYSIVYTVCKRRQVKKYFFNLSIHSVLYFPLAFVLIIVPYDMLINSTTLSVNSDQIATGGMYTALQGGLLYQMLMWFWWPIYTYWEPRNILTFHEYFKAPLSIFAPFLLYGTLLFYYLKNKINGVQTLIFFLILLIMFLLIKGDQAPFGMVYLLVLKYMPMSSVLRTPDNKIGFAIVFLISLLFIFISNKNNKKQVVAVLLFVIAVQCYPLYTGVAIQGENSEVSQDRIVSIPDEYKKLANYINLHKEPYGYIISFPPVEFGSYEHDRNNNEGHTGQDMLPMLTSLPFVYPTIGMSLAAYNTLNEIIGGEILELINIFPIRYILIRRDINSSDPLKRPLKNIPDRFNKVFESSLFTLYEDPLPTPMINSNNPQMNFRKINPVKYEINMSAIDKKNILIFAQSYRNSWALYPIEQARTQFMPDINRSFWDLACLWKKRYFKDTHKLHGSYANSWEINPTYIKNNIPDKYYKINPDGSMDLTLILYNKTQAVLYGSALISFAFAFLLLLFIIYSKIKYIQINIPGKT